MDIQEISDRLEIEALVHKYARAVDTRDWDLWRSLFTDEAIVDYSSAGAIAGSRDEVAAWLEQALSAMQMMQHFISNIEAEIDGDTAQVRAMFYNPMKLPGMEELSYCGGYYHHTLVRTPDGWRSRAMREENAWFANPLLPVQA
jgi:3-phenylpropionate/cinnamic acid dioxygenase small subunit